MRSSKKSVRVISKDGKNYFVTEMPGLFASIWAEDFLGDFCESIIIEVYRDGKKIIAGGVDTFEFHKSFDTRHYFHGLDQFMNHENLNALYADKFIPGDILLIPKEAGYRY